MYMENMLTTSTQCPTQAWSASCLIDLYMDAAEYQSGDDVGLSKLSIST